MKFGLICSPVLAELIGVAIFTLAPFLIALFNSDPTVVSFGVDDARTVSLFYCLLSFSHCCAGILRGMGRPVVPMAIMLCVWCALRITYITVTVHFIRTSTWSTGPTPSPGPSARCCSCSACGGCAFRPRSMESLCLTSGDDPPGTHW